MTGWADAQRVFGIYDPGGQPRVDVAVGTIVGVDVFASVLNLQGGAGNISAQIQFDLAENGGFLGVRPGDVITDPQSGVSLAVTHVDAARGAVLVTCGMVTEGTPASPVLPPVS